jgi:hypothetical protein
VLVAAAIGRGIVPIAYSSIAVMAVHLVDALPQGASILPEILNGNGLMAIADEDPGHRFIRNPLPCSQGRIAPTGSPATNLW